MSVQEKSVHKNTKGIWLSPCGLIASFKQITISSVWTPETQFHDACRRFTQSAAVILLVAKTTWCLATSEVHAEAPELRAEE